MKLLLSIYLDNAAFDVPAEGDYRSAYAIAKLLRQKVDEIEALAAVRSGDWGVCRDVNGNVLGDWVVE